MTYLFEPYTSAPAKTDKNAINYKSGGDARCIVIDKKTGYTLANCVAFVHAEWLKTLTAAVGRTKAIEYERKMCSNDAEVYAKSDYSGNIYFERSQTPKLGAIIVWTGVGSSKGHVMIVVGIKSNGDVVCDGSDYSGSKYYTRTIKKSDGYAFRNSYGNIVKSLQFACFILPPVEFALSIGTPVPRNNAYDQIQVGTLFTKQYARSTPSVKGEKMGYVTPGYYNVYVKKVADGYTWYSVGDFWVAGVTGRVSFLPKVERKYTATIKGIASDQVDKLKAWCKENSVAVEVKEE